MMFRDGALILLVGIIPVLAASRWNRYGQNAYTMSIGWLVAFEAFRPAASTGMAGGLELVQSDNASENMMGLFVLGGTVVALPALVRMMGVSSQQTNDVGYSVGNTLRKTAHLMYGGTARV